VAISLFPLFSLFSPFPSIFSHPVNPVDLVFPLF
jgi:hypothetical protein